MTNGTQLVKSEHANVKVSFVSPRIRRVEPGKTWDCHPTIYFIFHKQNFRRRLAAVEIYKFGEDFVPGATPSCGLNQLSVCKVST